MKKILLTTLAMASLVAFASIATAWEINIYGASAQFAFWSNNGQAYLEARGCTSVQKATYSNNGVVFQANCPARPPFGSGGVGYLRARSTASYDGCYAARGESRTGALAPGRDTTCDPNYFARPFPDNCTFPGSCTTLTCMNVSIGASDVPCECFTQESHGYSYGPTNSGGWLDLKFNAIDMTGISVCKPMVVTFAPFANVAVTKGGVSITNITRDNMELIFSGQVYDWSEIADVDGVPYDSKPMYVCLRHAGSGTHASLDAYLSSPVIINEVNGMFEFVESTGPMMTCINQTNVAAIGYADADRNPPANVRRLQLNGIGSTFAEIANANVMGTWNFYGVQHLYGAAASDLCDYLNDPAKVPAPFNAERELIYTRTGGNPADPCGAFPLGYRGAQ